MNAEISDRERMAEQTARNLRGLELERTGDVDSALALYQLNLDEGFEGDWPYARLVATHEKRGDFQSAAVVLERAIEVFSRSKRRTPADRRATINAFKGRLRLVQKEIRKQERLARRPKSGLKE